MKRVVFGLLLAFAAFTAGAEQRAFNVHLIEPAAGASAVAGSAASIAWEADNTPADVEEWEAFVSIDGGRTYPIRVTPHLDAGIRRFNWTVPSLPGAELSILLRFGDERQERPFAFPVRMRITGSLPRATMWHASASLRSEGEDDHGLNLVEWVEGSREGSDLKQVAARELALVPSREWNQDRGGRSVAAAGTSKRLDPAAIASSAAGDGVTRSRRNGRRLSLSRSLDILKLSQRLNI